MAAPDLTHELRDRGRIRREGGARRREAGGARRIWSGEGALMAHRTSPPLLRWGWMHRRALPSASQSWVFSWCARGATLLSLLRARKTELHRCLCRCSSSSSSLLCSSLAPSLPRCPATRDGPIENRITHHHYDIGFANRLSLYIYLYVPKINKCSCGHIYENVPMCSFVFSRIGIE